MKHGHLYNEGKKVINESVDSFVTHCLPGQMCDAFQLVVDEQLRSHHNKTKCVDETNERTEAPAVPRRVLPFHESKNTTQSTRHKIVVKHRYILPRNRTKEQRCHQVLLSINSSHISATALLYMSSHSPVSCHKGNDDKKNMISCNLVVSLGYRCVSRIVFTQSEPAPRFAVQVDGLG